MKNYKARYKIYQIIYVDKKQPYLSQTEFVFATRMRVEGGCYNFYVGRELIEFIPVEIVKRVLETKPKEIEWA